MTNAVTSVCARCLLLKHQASPVAGGEISHGLCREHELETLVAGGMATVAETEELAALRSDYIDLTVRVPGHVADRLRALGAMLEREAGRPADLRLVGGLALSRDLNRGDYETVPSAVYLIAPRTAPENS